MADTLRDGLPPLEYSECYLDSPSFRELIDLYDRELTTNKADLKALVKGCQVMIDATKEFSKTQQSFAHQLSIFRFKTIGLEMTEDEKLIMNSFQTFATLLSTIESFRGNMISTISVRLVETLDAFKKQQVQKARDEKKKFDGWSDKYYATLDNYLRMSVKKKEPNLVELNTSLERDADGFKQAAFDYACKLQDVHTAKQYELVEPFIGYVSDLTTFLHQAYDEAILLKGELHQMQAKIQIRRDTHESEIEAAKGLMAKVRAEGDAGAMRHPEYIKQGQLMVQDKKGTVGSAWHRYFCQFKKKEAAPGKPMTKLLKLTPTGRHTGIPSEFLEVVDCVRCKSIDIDREFCFEVELLSSKDATFHMQAFSGEMRKQWLDTLEGKEPTYVVIKKEFIGNDKVSPEGHEFVKKCVELIERRGGLEEEGIYRKPGSIAKCSKLVKDIAEKKMKISEMDQLDVLEWDNKTLSSAVRAYLSKQLSEPLMTFSLHEQLIATAKINDNAKRVAGIKELVDKLPLANRQMLCVIITHLCNVTALSDKNLMKASNLGVVFGPTLMRPERESVASIVDIKYQNIVVETMISEFGNIFPDILGQPCLISQQNQCNSPSALEVGSEIPMAKLEVGSLNDKANLKPQADDPPLEMSVPKRPPRKKNENERSSSLLTSRTSLKDIMTSSEATQLPK